jgi:Growth-Arrest-Specific Protein 2 Domain
MDKLQALREKHEVQYVPGDEVDRMVTEVLNELAESDMPIPGNFGRISEGFYKFGTRKIRAQILSGSLVVRVGGGFMTFREFVEKYGRLESVKVVRATNERKATTVVRRGSQLSTVGGDASGSGPVVRQRSGRAGRAPTSSTFNSSAASSSSSTKAVSVSASGSQVQGRRRRDAASVRKSGSRIGSNRRTSSSSSSSSSSSTNSHSHSTHIASPSRATSMYVRGRPLSTSTSTRRSLSRKPAASSTDRLALPGEGAAQNKRRVGSIRRSRSSERGLNVLKRNSTSDALLLESASPQALTSQEKRTTAPSPRNHRRSRSSAGFDA